MEHKEWRRTINGHAFLVSTGGLPHDFIERAFADDAMYWTKPISPANIQKMVDNSCVLGVYEVKDGTSSQSRLVPIGMARIITDYVTFAYLTDVYVKDGYRNLGLGKWLIACSKEIAQEMPELRRIVLLTGSDRHRRLYTQEMGMVVVGTEGSGLVAMHASRADLEAANTGGRSVPT